MATERFGSLALLSSAAASCLTFGPSAQAVDVHVPAEQSTIQAGIDAAVAGDVVLVSPGIYAEAINFNGKAITLRGAGGAAVTILDGASLDASMVKFITGEGSASTLQGFTVMHGKGTPDPGNEFVRRGGGVYASGASPTILNCQFVDNVIIGGGAVPSSHGGGVYLQNGAMALIDCTFSGNGSYGCSGSGGGMEATGSSPLLMGCTFIGNEAAHTVACAGTGSGIGGGLNADGGTFINCVFRQNFAAGVTTMGGSANGGGANGGGTFINCVFAGNTTSAFNSRGGGAYVSGAMINCTVTDNAATNGSPASIGGVQAAAPNVPSLTNCIVFGNSGPDVGPGASVTYSCIEGGYAGTGNISANPLFVDAANGDVHLQPGSPCIDFGNRALLPNDAHDLDGDGNFTETLSRDLGALRRIVNGQVDMGAYEWQDACLADVSPSTPGAAGDGNVDVDDLFIVINGWGACDACVADVNGDDEVDIDDLFDVINAWGECP